MFRSFPRRFMNTLRMPIKEKLFFLHVPKCGGNSIRDSLRKNFQFLSCKRERAFVYIQSTAEEATTRMLQEEKTPAFRLPYDSTLRTPEYLLLYHMNQGHVRCIVGHVPFSEIAYRNFSQQYRFITLLRDPVERWISEFFYNKSLHRFDSSLTLESYLDSPLGKAQGTQYVLYLGGRANGNDHYSAEACRRALDNLDRFTEIGFLDKLDIFAERFAERFGARLEIGRKNVTAYDKSREKLSKAMRRRIENLCELDCEIYHQARSRFL